jgi:hypothetical protein
MHDAEERIMHREYDRYLITARRPRRAVIFAKTKSYLTVERGRCASN